MASTPNFEELDDVLFGVSTRHQWNQLITQIEATNKANKGHSRNSRKSHSKKCVLQERNGSVNPTWPDQEQKDGSKVLCLFVCLYLSSLLFWLIDAIHSKILLPGSHLFLHKLVKRIKLLTLSLPRSCWVILLVIYHNPYDVSVENLVLDQLINPWLIFLFILLTCLLDIVSML